MKHIITLTFAMLGCSEAPQRSAFDPQSVAERSTAEEVPSIRSGDADAFASVEPESPLPVFAEESVEEPAEEAHLPAEPEGRDADAQYSTVTVRSGESLDRLSRWANSSVEEIAVLNQLEITAPLIPGQVLEIPVSDGEAFESSRDGAFEKRLERYLSSNGGLAGIEGYTVRTGDTAWAIAKHVAGVPSWVLAAFNAETSLDHLSVGDTLYVPIMTQVADNEEPMDELTLEPLAVAPIEALTDQP